MKDVVIGVDIGGTYTKYGIVDREGNCLYENSICTNSKNGVDLYVKEVSETLMNDLSRDGSLKLNGIGIGAPNGNYYKGTIEFAPNLKWKGIIPLAELFKKHINVPVVLTNDANAAAIGEMVFGAAKNMRDFIVITLGTGLGSGIVSNGQVVYGHDGFAGEIGHTIVRHNGRECGCGRQGCLETYVSATGIKRTVYKLLADSLEDSSLRRVSFNELSADMITEAAKQGDKIAISAFEYTGSLLGQKLADSVAHTSPEAIFLFGGLAKAGDYILAPTRTHLEKNLLHIYKNKVKVLLSGLAELNAAVMGASALAWKELEKH
jgi:glucokinase